MVEKIDSECGNLTDEQSYTSCYNYFMDFRQNYSNFLEYSIENELKSVKSKMAEKCFKLPTNEEFLNCTDQQTQNYKSTQLGASRKAIFQVRRDLINTLLNTNFEMKSQ